MDGGDCAPVSLDHMALSALPTCKYPPTSTPVGGQERRAPLLRPSPVEPPHQERVRSRNREWDLRRAAVGAAAVQEAPLGLRVAQVLANEQAEPDAEAGLKRDHLLFLWPIEGPGEEGVHLVVLGQEDPVLRYGHLGVVVHWQRGIRGVRRLLADVRHHHDATVLRDGGQLANNRVLPAAWLREQVVPGVAHGLGEGDHPVPAGHRVRGAQQPPFGIDNDLGPSPGAAVLVPLPSPRRPAGRGAVQFHVPPGDVHSGAVDPDGTDRRVLADGGPVALSAALWCFGAAERSRSFVRHSLGSLGGGLAAACAGGGESWHTHDFSTSLRLWMPHISNLRSNFCFLSQPLRGISDRLIS